jgi:hypothetical protein
MPNNPTVPAAHDLTASRFFENFLKILPPASISGPELSAPWRPRRHNRAPRGPGFSRYRWLAVQPQVACAPGEMVLGKPLCYDTSLVQAGL